MLSDDKLKLISDEIRTHYAVNTQPYYLSTLGEFLRSKDILIPPGMRLKEFLTEFFGSDLIVVQDPAVNAKIAIALPDNQDQIKQQLAGQFPSSHGRAPIEVARLPFSLIAAFCQAPEAGKRVYYRTVRPCRYAISYMAPDDSYVEIGEHFLKSVPDGISIRELSDGARQEIYRSIGDWAAAQNVNLEDLYLTKTDVPRSAPIDKEIMATNALQRLIEAQDIELKKRIQIPGDIALVLMRIE